MWALRAYNRDMKKNILLFLATLLCLNVFSIERSCGFTIEGAEPTVKKYCFKVTKPDGFDSSEYQFIMWKILKDRGYELVSPSEAAIIIQLNFINREVLHEGHESVFIGEKTTQAFGQDIQIPIYEKRSTGHYTDKFVNLEIKAMPIGSDENSIPIWKMSMGKADHDSKFDFLYGIDFIWLQEGYQYISYKIEGKKGKPYVSKLKSSNGKATSEQRKVFTERIQYLKSKIDAEEYNQQLNRK